MSSFINNSPLAITTVNNNKFSNYKLTCETAVALDSCTTTKTTEHLK